MSKPLGRVLPSSLLLPMFLFLAAKSEAATPADEERTSPPPPATTPAAEKRRPTYEKPRPFCGKVVTRAWLLRKDADLAALLPRTIIHGGLKRTYLLYVPKSLKKSPPLVVALHGGFGDGRRMEELTRNGFNLLAEREGFLVAYPNGVEHHWNDGRAKVRYRAQREKVDDVGFLAALIDELAGKFNVDRRRVYVTGASNGGMMSFRLALELSDKIAAVAPVIASLPVEYKDAKPPRPVPVLIINGTKDPLMPWAGGEIGASLNLLLRRKLGTVLSTPETVRFWVRRNGCVPRPEKTLLPDKAPDDGTRVTVETYAGGKSGAEVILCRVAGGGHTWPNGKPYLPERIIGKVCRDFNAAEYIWAFFKKHHLPNQPRVPATR